MKYLTVGRHRLLLVMLVAFVGNAQGGFITSGYINVPGHGDSANFSGPGFSATIIDADYDDNVFMNGGFAPYTAPYLNAFVYSGLSLGGGLSSVTYNGVYYGGPGFSGPLPGTSYVGQLGYSLSLISPQPTITGTGVYPVTYSVQMDFCLNDSTHVQFYCESDTGLATGAWNANADINVPSWVWLTNGITLNIVPEPSTGILLFAGIAVLGYLRRRYAAGDVDDTPLSER